jgi:tRNA (guanine37-N1)-methyltransferase
MNIDILTLFPEMFDSPFGHSIIKRAVEKELVTIGLHDIRDYSQSKHRSVDDYPFGGGAGMVMQIEPIDLCISALKDKNVYDEIIYLSPDGELFDQKMANQLSLKGNLLLICGHYKGIDQRIRDLYITMDISIGDYVLSGGELAAAVLMAGILGVATVVEKLARAFLDDGKLTLEEINAAFSKVDKNSK